MSPADRFAEAFAYAWWLTGDDEQASAAAELAVGAAVDTDGKASGDGVDALALLSAVRSAAVDRPTMCPASEVALLHDGHLVDLGDAASLVQIDPQDARTELAHGRLEALMETPSAPILHPERLGGLAVGSPADVAHARQCDSCAAVRDLIQKGRDELRGLPRPTPPPGRGPAPAVLGAGRSQEPPTAVAAPAALAPPAGPDPAGPPPAARPATGSAAAAPAPAPASTESPATAPEPAASTPLPDPADESVQTAPPSPERAADAGEDGAPGGSRRTAVIVAVIVVVVLAFFVAIIIASTFTTSGAEMSAEDGEEVAATEAPAAAPEEVEDGTAAAPEEDEAEATPAPAQGGDDGAAAAPEPPEGTDTSDDTGTPTEGLRVTEAAVVGADGDHLPSGASLDGQEPVRVSVTYTGAESPLELRARWTVDGEDFRTLAVQLPAGDRTHTLGAPPPADGWPRGTHQLVLSADGGVLAAVDFRVV